MADGRIASIDDLPRDLSRPARTVLFAAQIKANAITGEVERGADGSTPQQRLSRWCGWEGRSAVSSALDELCSSRLMWRAGHAVAQRLYALLLPSDRKTEQDGRPPCEVCGGDATKLRGSTKCAACMQVARREWKGIALAIWRRGKMSGWTDDKIAYTIHARTGRPLWGRAEEETEAVITAMCAMGLFPDEMMRAVRIARDGVGRVNRKGDEVAVD